MDGFVKERIMGWLFLYEHTKRKMIIADRCRSWSRIGHNGALMTSRVVAQCYRGNPGRGVLWSVREWYNEKTGESTDRIICCDLLEYSRRDGCWGYKSMDEGMGPCYYSCPQKYLDMTPADINPCFNASWREAVEGVRELKRTTKDALRTVRDMQKLHNEATLNTA